MSKRKLSLQQRRRIAEQRAKNKARQQANAVTEDATELSELQPGLVVAHFGHEVVVEGESGTQKCHLRANLDLCTGDKVMWRAGPELGVVESRDRRSSEIQRPDSYGKLRTIASNVSQLLITIAPEPAPHSNLIDRYLVAAHLHQLKPLIVINKVDHSELSQVLEIEKTYRSLGYNSIHISAQDGTGLEQFKKALSKNTSIFVGQSGVGKSSLVKLLLPDEDIRIGELSNSEAKGRHTTTNSQLYHFPFGGYCIDSPGIREFGLWHATRADILAGFPEIAEAAEQCKFRNCGHQSEPQCGVKDALVAKRISEARYVSYETIVNQLDDVVIKTQTGIKNK